MIGVRRTGGWLAIALGIGLLVVPVPRARAATVDATGWWFRASTATPTSEIPQALSVPPPTAPVVAPGPPSVAADQLHVEGTPQGATAIAAMTFRLARTEGSPILTITPDQTSVLPPEAVVLACRAAVEWVPPATPPGPWETKPLVDCSRSVQGQPGEGGTLVFPLQPLVSGSVVDVVIVPGTLALPPEVPADVPRNSAFSLTFDRPQAASLATSPVTPQDDEEEEFDDEEFFDDDGSFGDDGSSFGVGATDFDPLGSLALDPVADAPAAPALEPQDQAPSIPRVATPIAAVPIPDVGDVRKLGLVLLLAGVLAAYLAANQPVRSTVGLGRFRRPVPIDAVTGTAVDLDGNPPCVTDRGLGRLRRPRTGEPPSL